MHWGIQNPVRQGPLSVPGRYAVRMAIGGQTYTQPFEVRLDPKIDTPASDLAASTAAQVRTRDDIDASVAMINALEVMRKQIEDYQKANAGRRQAEQALAALDKKMMDVELQLLTRTEMHSDDKWYVEAYKVYMNLVWLSGVIGSGAGDVQGGADYRPTDSSLQVLDMIERDLAQAKADYAALIEQEIPAFNRANVRLRITIPEGAK